MRGCLPRRSLGGLAASVWLSVLPLAGAAGPNLVPNGGFEGGLEAVTRTGWQLDPTATVEAGAAAMAATSCAALPNPPLRRRPADLTSR
jgi:hypothetical protein